MNGASRCAHECWMTLEQVARMMAASSSARAGSPASAQGAESSMKWFRGVDELHDVLSAGRSRKAAILSA